VVSREVSRRRLRISGLHNLWEFRCSRNGNADCGNNYDCPSVCSNWADAIYINDVIRQFQHIINDSILTLVAVSVERVAVVIICLHSQLSRKLGFHWASR
jgi:hypothetical protein